MKLIDKDAVVAAIDEIVRGLQKNCNPNPMGNIIECLAAAQIEVVNLIKDSLDTLEVKDVDLDKELENLIEKEKAFVTDNREVKYYNGDSFNHIYELEFIAKHFFELGLKIQKSEDKFARPDTDIKDAIEVTSRLKYVDDDLRPVADFIMNYASWNLHKDEWNQPTIEVPLFRVLDALAQRGKPYCCKAQKGE